MTVLKGFLANAGFKKATALGWGTPIQLVALDGVEMVNETIQARVTLIEDLQLSGAHAQREGTAGSRLFAGDFVTAARYEGLEPLLAQVFGTAGAPTTVDLTAKQHVLMMNNSLEGIFGTLVIDKKVKLWELVSVKVTGFHFECGINKRAQIAFHLVAKDLNDATNALATPGAPTVTPTGTAGSTTYGYRIVAKNRFGQTLAGTETTTTTGNATLSASNYNAVSWSAVTGATSYDVYGRAAGAELFMATVVSGLTFNDYGTITPAGALPGSNTTAVNNAGTFASVTLPANREFLQFPQLVARINSQSGAALGSGDVAYITDVRVDVDRVMKIDDVTTNFSDTIEEPIQNGFTKVTGSVGFSKLMDGTGGSYADFQAALTKGRQKMDLTFLSASLAGSSSQRFQWLFQFPNVQFLEGTPTIPGPGLTPWTLPFQGFRVTSAPTGMANVLDPLVMTVISQRALDPLT